MRCNTLRKLTRLLVTLVGTAALSGCHSMNGFVMNSSGQSYYEQGNYPAAASEFQQAMLSDPTNPDYMANLAKARSRMGDVAGSEQLYRQALMASPSHQPSYHGLAELMVAQGRGQEASAMLTTWAATQPYVAESHLELGWLQRQLGEHDMAAQSLQKALQVNPGHATALAHLGQYHQDMGRHDQAVAMYQQSLQADWNQPEVHSRLSAAAQAAGGSHPMAQMAMSRGVHPYDVPRPATAFGPPSQGVQMAQRQMQQPGRMQFAGMPQPQMQRSQMAMQQMPMQQMAMQQMPMQQMPMQQMPMQMAQTPMPMPMAQTTVRGHGSGMTYSPPMMALGPMMASGPMTGSGMPPHQVTANSAGYPSLQQALDSFTPTAEPGWTVVPGSLRVVESGTTAAAAPVVETAAAPAKPRSAAVPAPRPDPSFSPAGRGGVPVKSISGGTNPGTPSEVPPMGLTATGGSSAEPPVLDAF